MPFLNLYANVRRNYACESVQEIQFYDTAGTPMVLGTFNHMFTHVSKVLCAVKKALMSLKVKFTSLAMKLIYLLTTNALK